MRHFVVLNGHRRKLLFTDTVGLITLESQLPLILWRSGRFVLVLNVLGLREPKRLVPVIMVKIWLFVVGRVHCRKVIIMYDMVLRRDFSSIQVQNQRGSMGMSC